MYLQPVSLSLDLEQTSMHLLIFPSEVAHEPAAWWRGLVSLDERLQEQEQRFQRTGTITGLGASDGKTPRLGHLGH